LAISAFSGSTSHLNVSSILTGDLNVLNISGTVVTPTPTPTPTPSPSPSPAPAPPGGAVTNYIQNAGVYITNKSPKAGSSVLIHNSFLANRALSNVSLRLEIRQISSSGALSAAIVTKSYTGLNFAANEK